MCSSKRSVLRRQSGDTNRNTKRSVYCQYGKYGLTFRALALRQREVTFTFTQRVWLQLCLPFLKLSCRVEINTQCTIHIVSVQV